MFLLCLPVLLPSLLDKLGNAGVNLLSAYLVRLGVSSFDASITMGFIKCAGVLGPILAGQYTDKWGAKRVTVLSFLASGIGFLLIPFFSVWQAIAILGFLAFLGTSCSRIALRNLLVQLVPAEKLKEAIGWARAFTNSGTTLAFIVAGYVASQNFKVVYFLDGATSLLACAVFLILMRHKENFHIKSVNYSQKLPLASVERSSQVAQNSTPNIPNLKKETIFEPQIKTILLYAFSIFLHFLLYTMFDVSLPARYEKLFPNIGASYAAYANVVNTVLCALAAIPAAKYLKPKLFWLVFGNIAISCGAVLAHYSPSQPALFGGMFLYTIGEVTFTSCSLYFLIQLTQKTQRPAFWYGVAAAIYGSAQPIAGFLAFPLAVDFFIIPAWQWFVIIGFFSTASVWFCREHSEHNLSTSSKT